MLGHIKIIISFYSKVFFIMVIQIKIKLVTKIYFLNKLFQHIESRCFVIETSKNTFFKKFDFQDPLFVGGVAFMF